MKVKELSSTLTGPVSVWNRSCIDEIAEAPFVGMLRKHSEIWEAEIFRMFPWARKNGDVVTLIELEEEEAK